MDHARAEGGAYVNGGSPTFVDVHFLDNLAAIYNAYGYYTGLGGGIEIADGDVLLENAVFDGNYAGTGGSAILLDVGTLTFLGGAVTNHGAEFLGGGIETREGTAQVENVLFWGNAWPVYVSTVFGDVRLQNVVIDGTGATNTGGAIAVSAGTLTVNNSVIVGNDAGRVGVVYVTGGSVTFQYTDAWNNAPGNYEGITAPTGTNGNIEADPAFYESAWRLDPASPLVDAGDPTLVDPDGTVSDIGLFGGSAADELDLDRDGYAGWWLPGAYDAATSPSLDCDDQDPEVFPGQGC